MPVRVPIYRCGARVWSMCPAPKGERLAVRMTTRQKHDIEWAEEVLGRNVTEFSVQALTERASEVLTDRHVFGVSQTQWGQFVGQLEQPLAVSVSTGPRCDGEG